MIYAVGDIHGHIDKLHAAHDAIREDMARQNVDRAPVIHLGDLCDRGPATHDVIQYLIDGIAAGEDWQVLKGNHDRIFCDFLLGGDGTDPRLRNGVSWFHSVMGGQATLSSYGFRKSVLEKAEKFARRARAGIPESHATFLKGLPLWVRAEGMIFVHAGIRPGFPLEAQDEDDLLWIRDEFLWHLDDHEALIVHGHTPVDEPTHYGNRVNIDTGAGWGNPLIPVVFDDGVCFALRDGSRQKLSVPKHRPKTVLRR
jgi:serine/threonine protein phosphatase 1